MPSKASDELRDVFAGLAMQGMVEAVRGNPKPLPLFAKEIAQIAYLVADAMLAEREAKPQQTPLQATTEP